KARNSEFYGAVAHGYVLPTYSIIPVASVDLTPSREDIRMSDRSIKFLTSLFESIAEEFSSLLIEDIDTAPTRVDALVRINDYQRVTGVTLFGKATWQGQIVPEYVDAEGTRIRYHVGVNSTSINDFSSFSTIELANKAKNGKTYLYVEGPAPTGADDDEEVWDKFITAMRRDFRGYINLKGDHHGAVSLRVFEG